MARILDLLNCDIVCPSVVAVATVASWQRLFCARVTHIVWGLASRLGRKPRTGFYELCRHLLKVYLSASLYIVWIVLMNFKLIFYSPTNDAIFKLMKVVFNQNNLLPLILTPPPPSEDYLIGCKNVRRVVWTQHRAAAVLNDGASRSHASAFVNENSCWLIYFSFIPFLKKCFHMLDFVSF